MLPLVHHLGQGSVGFPRLVGGTPAVERSQDVAEVQALLGQAVFGTRRVIAAKDPFDKTTLL